MELFFILLKRTKRLNELYFWAASNVYSDQKISGKFWSLGAALLKALCWEEAGRFREDLGALEPTVQNFR